MLLATPTFATTSASVFPSGTPLFTPLSPEFEDRIHPASLDACGQHDPALLELIRSDVSRDLICELSTLKRGAS